MQDTSLFRELLGLRAPWKVSRVQVASEEKSVEAWLAHRRGAKFPCAACGRKLPVYDHLAERTWRHLDSGPWQTWVHARLPRVACRRHGVHQIQVPWAEPRQQFTRAFENRAIEVLREADVLGATRLLQISWDEAWGVMERAVARGQDRKQPQPLSRLGVDEKAIAKGHRYVTLVSNLDQGTVEYVADDRKQASLDGFYQGLTPGQLASIEAIAMDMWDPYIASTKAHVPGAVAKIVFDRYHVMKHMLAAVDAVRKAEHRALRAAGDETLTGTKYLWLYSEENLPEYHEERLAQLRRLHLKTGRAWAIKESLRDMWDYRYWGWASRHWQRWYYWATHSRLKPVIRVARLIEAHLPNVLTYFDHRITNAVSEGLNSKIQTIKKTPAGFAIGSISRSPSTFTAADSICIPGSPSEKCPPVRLPQWYTYQDYRFIYMCTHVLTHRKPG
jgi:transposase